MTVIRKEKEESDSNRMNRILNVKVKNVKISLV